MKSLIIGLVAASMLFASGNATDSSSLDSKMQSVTAGTAIEYDDVIEVKEKSQEITFKNLPAYKAGNTVGKLQVQNTTINSFPIVVAESGTDAQERAARDANCAYLFYVDGGENLNAAYMNILVPEGTMQTLADMDSIYKIKSQRYIHCWITTDTERLQMDLLGAYYSDDMDTGKGILRVATEETLIPKGLSQLDKMDYLVSCFDKKPTDEQFTKMLTISTYGDNNKRMMVFVNVK